MYFKKDIKQGVQNIQLLGGNLFYLSNGQVHGENQHFMGPYYGIESNSNGIFMYRDQENVKTDIYTKTDKFIKTELSLKSSTYDGIKTIVRNKDYSNKVNQIGMYFFEYQRINWFQNLLPFGSCTRFENFIFIPLKKILRSVDFNTGNEIWNKDFSTYGQISKILGVCGENLWVSCMSVDENRHKKAHLLALNVDTGERIHHLSDNLPLHEVNLVLIEEKQRIVSMWGKMSSHAKAESPFVEIDALTGEVIRNTFSQSLFDANLKIGEWKYLNGKIYFHATYDTINSTHIGVMDYETLELEWFEEVKERKAGLRNLQVTENKIYIMDSGNQLFTYQKEEL